MKAFLTRLLHNGLVFATIMVNIIAAGIVTLSYLFTALVVQWWHKHIQ